MIVPAVLWSQSAGAVTHAQLPMGSDSSFAVVAGSTITNTGASVISGNLGLDPGSAVSGLLSSQVVGTEDIDNGPALQAQADLTTAFNDAAALAPTAAITADLGGQTLTPGVYNSGSSVGLTGTVILNGEGNPNSIFVIQAGSTLTTATNSAVSLTDGAQACNVFWQVGSSATLNTGTIFMGTVMAQASVTLQTGTSVTGRVLAQTGAVTLDDNDITRPDCRPSVGIVKTTNGGNGLPVAKGSPVTWNYLVTNTSKYATLTDVTVTDNKVTSASIDCGNGTNVIASLAPGASQDCTATGTASQGVYFNKGTVTATTPGGGTVGAVSKSSYLGFSARLQLGETINGASDQSLAVGTPLTWNFEVTNTGSQYAPLTNVTVTDTKVAAAAIDCGSGSDVIALLAPGASQSCTATGTAQSGKNVDASSASGTPPAGAPITHVAKGGYTGTAQPPIRP